MQLIKTVIGGRAVTVIIGVTVVIICLLLDPLSVLFHLICLLRFVFLKPRQVGVTPEANVGPSGYMVPVPGLGLRSVLCLVVVVTDGGVSATLCQHCHLGCPVQ